MDERVLSVINRLEAFMRTTDDAMAIPRDAGEFVHVLLTATGARRGVEIGTSYGFSALWAGAAIARQGGRSLYFVRHFKDHADQRHLSGAR